MSEWSDELMAALREQKAADEDWRRRHRERQEAHRQGDAYCRALEALPLIGHEAAEAGLTVDIDALEARLTDGFNACHSAGRAALEVAERRAAQADVAVEKLLQRAKNV